MAMRLPLTSLRCIALLLAAALLTLSTLAEAAIRFKRTGEETLGGADALAGVPEACNLEGQQVWVESEGRGECIAYFPSRAIRGARTAVLYFEGDVPHELRSNPERLKGHLRTLRSVLGQLTAAYRIPYVLVARPGTFGSTGSHRERRKEREYLVMRAAVDAIRERHGLATVALAGQSGGATIVAALLTLGIRNVRCAAPASGGFDLAVMLDWHAQRQGVQGLHQEHPASIAGDFNVMERVDRISLDPGRRVFVVGDRADQVTPFNQQRRFAERLREAGHHAELVEARGTGPERHGLGFAALTAAGLCATGASDADVRRAVTR